MPAENKIPDGTEIMRLYLPILVTGKKKKNCQRAYADQKRKLRGFLEPHHPTISKGRAVITDIPSQLRLTTGEKTPILDEIQFLRSVLLNMCFFHILKPLFTGIELDEFVGD